MSPPPQQSRFQLHTATHVNAASPPSSPSLSLSHGCPLGCRSRCDKCCRLNQSTPPSPSPPPSSPPLGRRRMPPCRLISGGPATSCRGWLMVCLDKKWTLFPACELWFMSPSSPPPRPSPLLSPNHPTYTLTTHSKNCVVHHIVLPTTSGVFVCPRLASFLHSRVAETPFWTFSGEWSGHP